MRDIKTPGKKKIYKSISQKGGGGEAGAGYVCACVFKSLSKSKPQPKCTSAGPEKPPTLSANVQDEIQTNFLLIFFPHLFKQMLWIFILLYKNCRKRPKKIF